MHFHNLLERGMTKNTFRLCDVNSDLREICYVAVMNILQVFQSM